MRGDLRKFPREDLPLLVLDDVTMVEVVLLIWNDDVMPSAAHFLFQNIYLCLNLNKTLKFLKEIYNFFQQTANVIFNNLFI